MHAPGPSFRIHHLKALYEWILSQGQTPCLTLVAAYPGNTVPEGYASSAGVLRLDISPQMVSSLAFALDTGIICLVATFGGKSKLMRIQAGSVTSLCALESDRGEVFQVVEPEAVRHADTRPRLRIVPA